MPSRRTAALALTLALSGVVACTAPDPAPSAPEVSPERSVPATGDSAPATSEPIVIVTHATAPPEQMTVSRARRVMQGEIPAEIVAAPDLATGEGVEVARSPAAALRAVEKGTHRYGVVPAHALKPTVRRVRVGGVDPLRRPLRYPLQTPGDPPPQATTLTVVGDIMLTRGVSDPAAALRPMRDRLRGADITVGNLESTLSTAGPPQQGGDSFGAGPEILEPLRRAGFDALSLANNHTGDFGEQALLDTVRVLRDSPIEPFGAGRDLAQAARPARVHRHGTDFAFLGFNAIGETPRATPQQPGALSVRMPPRTGPLQEQDLRFVEAGVRDLGRRADVVVVLPHWGTQYTHRPEPIQRTVARRLVRAGADLVVGGHPHWVQGLETHRGTVIAHSLGNFVFDMDFMIETQQGVVLEATFWGPRLMSVDLVPYRMDASFAPRIVGGGEAADILNDVWSTSRGPFARP